MEENINERLDNLESKLFNLQILKSIDFFKLFTNTDIIIHLNHYLKNSDDLKRFLDYLKLDYQAFIPCHFYNIFQPEKNYINHSEQERKKLTPESFDLSFNFNTNFQNLYILVEVLSKFGLKSIYYTNEKSNIVTIGSYVYESDHNPLSNKIDVAEFLQTPFYYSMLDFLTKKFNKSEEFISNNLEYDFDEEHYASMRRKDDDYNDYERDTFNTLTDGQYGDYEDRKENSDGNNFDDLRDNFGY
jgi:hypothetical protein